MTTTNYLETLRNKHRTLDKKIMVLESEKAPELYIHNMKKEKLILKDKIAFLEKELSANES